MSTAYPRQERLKLKKVNQAGLMLSLKFVDQRVVPSSEVESVDLMSFALAFQLKATLLYSIQQVQ